MWFKSKLENPDPAIRRQYAEDLAPEDVLLTEIAREDPHPDVRSTALNRTTDLSTIDQMARGDADQSIRSLAAARLQTLMSGTKSPAPPLDTRLQFVSDTDDQRLLRYVARSGMEPELRKIAVSRLLSRKDEPDVQDLLCEIAADDAVREIRKMAAEPIHDIRRLQMLLDKSRERDKSIHRLARERLDSIQAQQDAQEALEKSCLDVEQLCAHHFSADGKLEEGRLAKIKADWDNAAKIVDTMDEPLQTRYSTACDRIATTLAEVAQQRRHRTDILAALRLHLSDTGDEPVAALIKKWHDLDEPTAQQAREFSKLVAEVTEHDSQRDRDNHRVVAKQGLLKKMEQAAAADSIRTTTLARFEERWAAAPDPENPELKNELQDSFLPLREKLRAKLEKQAQELGQRLAKVTTLLDQYDTALEEGKLRTVVASHDKIVNALSQLEAPQDKKLALVKRLRAGEPKMAELRQWRHWGTEKKREELSEQAEALSTTDMKIPEIAKAVRACREAWKALDKSDGPAGRNLWRRFDAACEKAYEPCQAHFDQQKAKRKENMAQRVAICDELDALHKNTDWDTPPWRELADALHESQRKWYAAGSVDRRERDKIQKRYEKSCAAIDEHLTAMRLQEMERREALITKVEALTTEEDTARAVDTAKRAQREWKPVVQAGRRKEQDLWKRFRAACDTVFERRKEQFAEADNERAQNLAEKLAVCGQIEEIAAELKKHLEAGSGEVDSVNETRQKANQLNSGWQRIGPIPRAKQQSIDKRYDRVCKELDEVCGRLDRQLKQKARQVQIDAASDCDRLELAIATGDSIDASAVEDILNKLGKVSANSGLARRIKRLKDAATGDARTQKEISDSLPANLEIRRKLCLEMEIAANIDSPEEHKEERMQYRVKQLSESMSGTRKQMTPDELERLWYETGPVLLTDKANLETRFRRALEALSGD